MPQDQMEFANETGNELFRLLVERAEQKLDGVEPFDRFSAMLGASLIATAEVLRGPAEQARDIEPLIAMCGKWLRMFLTPPA